jgi:CubicO group peptidase (beta-lactamase class C family)
MVGGDAEHRFRRLVQRFERMFRKPGQGGGALAVYWQGEKVVDVWAGYADPIGQRPWQAETASMSFSTTKGVASTAVHRLVDRGLLAYDEPLGSYWDAFNAPERRHVTLRKVLSHQAGLHRIRGVVPAAEDLLDHTAVTDLLLEQSPRPPRNGAPAYHGFTIGWLLGGLVEQVTGRGLRQVVREELADVLDLDGFWIGAPREEWDRVAELFPPLPGLISYDRVGAQASRLRRTRHLAQALFVEGFEKLLFDDPNRRILTTEMAAANGVFTARDLAKMYAALANEGAVDGVQLLSPGLVHEVGRVQTRARDAVLGIPMRWRLGYHQAFTAGRPAWKAFGHFGYGGSGGWADPETRLAVAFVTNRMGGTAPPAGDLRLLRLGAGALAAARGR